MRIITIFLYPEIERMMHPFVLVNFVIFVACIFEKTGSFINQ